MPTVSQKHMLSTVVLGDRLNGGNFAWLGTGFFFGVEEVNLRNPDFPTLHRYLITNKHMLREPGEEVGDWHNTPRLVVRIDRYLTGAASVVDLELLANDQSPIWLGHPRDDVDVAVIPVKGTALESIDPLRYFESRESWQLEACQNLGVGEGSPIAVLGFPFGMTGDERNYAIARGGVIARIHPAFDARMSGQPLPDFLIDAHVYGGNSGGPVVYAADHHPEAASRLIGIVKSVLLDPDTDEPNHLAVVEPVDSIRETIALHLKSLIRPGNTIR